MEVMVPAAQEFHFDSACTSPYMSPQRFGDPFDRVYHYTSAPTSPTRAAAIFAEFSRASNKVSSSSRDLLDWEEKHARRKSSASCVDDDADEFDFAFDFSGQLEKGGQPPVLTAADELFEKGKIRPLMPPPPRLEHPMQHERRNAAPSPRSRRAKGFWSPRGHGGGEEERRDRGRDRAPPPPSISSSKSRRGSRSLSPLRGGGDFHQRSEAPTTSSPLHSAAPSSPTTTTTIASILKGGGSKKWRLRDLLLFRSASEGRATGRGSKDPLHKYTLLSPSPSSSSLPPLSSKRSGGGEDSKNSSFRKTDGGGSMRKGYAPGASAHALHYTANRAASEEMKKKTALPYRQGLFACLRFNPAVHSIAKGLNSYSFNHK